jgi:phenylalanine ammonia-lyase
VKNQTIVVSGERLSIANLMAVARYGSAVELSGDETVRGRVLASCDFVQRAVQRGDQIYGVTSGFGGMGHIVISPEDAASLQKNLLRFLKVGTGSRLPDSDVRAAMLLRANSLMRGASGIRLEIIERLLTFINAGVTPHVFDLGSIGASGDLVPLANIAGAIIGLDSNYLVDFQGEAMGAPEALRRLGLEPLTLGAKEGLAMVNGTAVLTGIAAGCIYDAHTLLALSFGAHAMMLQGMSASNQPYNAFIHDHKPHPGQRFAAARMLELLKGSDLIRNDVDGQNREFGDGRLIQDRYSVRCLPQFLGPVIDGIVIAEGQLEVEMNSATDNPLFDGEAELSYHGGNFLGQYVGVGMDHFRYYLGLLAKHLDVQIAVLMEPAFSGGLPGSLSGNPERKINMGLKGLQISGNSIMPLIAHLGNSLADRFPTHAEQYNQNINSQGFGSANLARQSVELFRNYLSHALIFGVQSIDLRTYKMFGHYDARPHLSPSTLALYEAVKSITGGRLSSDRPFIYNDDEQGLDDYLALLTRDIACDGQLRQAILPLLKQIENYHPYRLA